MAGALLVSSPALNHNPSPGKSDILSLPFPSLPLLFHPPAKKTTTTRDNGLWGGGGGGGKRLISLSLS